MKRIAFFLASIYCLTACNNELIGDLDPNQNETNPPITLNMPDLETVNLYSAATISENCIDTIWVLAFNNTTGAKLWVEKIPGSLITRNGDASQLLPQLAHKPENGTRIVCIANVDPNPDTLSVTYNSINICFRIQNRGYYYGNDYLPMYGDTLWSNMSGYACDMKRAVAKIQVQMGTSVAVADSVGIFSADNVRYKIYNGGGAGTIQPPASGVSSGGNAFNPETDYRYIIQRFNANEQNSNTYIFEFPSSDHYAVSGPPAPAYGSPPDSTFYPERLHLILEKDNSPDPVTYYRLDFYNPVTKKYLDIVRNHHYLFTIDKVRSEGYTTLAQAQNNPGSNIEYTVTTSDGANHMTSNGQYGVVTADLLPRVTGSIDTLALTGLADNTTNYPIVSARIQLPNQMNWYSATRNEIEVQPAANFVLTNPSPNNYLAPPPAASAPISIKVLSGTPTNTAGVLIFRVGNVVHRVNFKFTL